MNTTSFSKNSFPQRNSFLKIHQNKKSIGDKQDDEINPKIIKQFNKTITVGPIGDMPPATLGNSGTCTPIDSRNH